MDKFELKKIQVCSSCKRVSCWHGEFYCDDYRSAGLEIHTVYQLRKMKTHEHEDHWSDKKMIEVYGEAAPFGYEDKNAKPIIFNTNNKMEGIATVFNKKMLEPFTIVDLETDKEIPGNPYKFRHTGLVNCHNQIVSDDTLRLLATGHYYMK